MRKRACFKGALFWGVQEGKEKPKANQMVYGSKETERKIMSFWG